MKKILLLIISVLLMNSSFANTAQMNTTLSRINTILSHINPLINLAERQQDKQARIQFHFKQLRSDISKIQGGIGAQINRVTIEPRLVKPLTGDYLPRRKLRNKPGGAR